MTAIDVARHLTDTIKLREDAGHNKDKAGIIAQMNREVGAALDAPYCASTVSRCAKKAGAGTKFPYSASSQAIKRAFRDKGLLFDDPDRLKECRGAIGGWTNVGDVWHGHIFWVEQRLTDWRTKKVVAVVTLEGNTDSNGTREGNGMYRKKRVLKSDGLWYPVDSKGKVIGAGHKLWFGDTSAIPGCAYWDIENSNEIVEVAPEAIKCTCTCKCKKCAGS